MRNGLWFPFLAAALVFLAGPISVSIFGLGGLEAQEYSNLEGRIIDGETGDPVVAAAVQVVGRPDVFQTAEDGRFLINTVRVDELTLVVQRLGYFPLQVHLRLEANGETQIALDDDLPLRPLPIELRELVVELEDPWLDQGFQSKSFYRRNRLYNRDDIRRTPFEMQTMLSNLGGAARVGCGFDFYIDGRWVHPASVKGLVMSRAPIEFEAAEVYYSNARMGQRQSPTNPFRPEGSGADSPTGSRDLGMMPCGVFRLWSLGHRQLGERQYLGPMDSSRMGPLMEGMGEVRGRLSGADGRLVPGILVTAVDELGAPASAAVTDAEGRYVMRVPAPASYILVAVRPGFPDWRSEGFVLEDGQVLDIPAGGR